MSTEAAEPSTEAPPPWHEDSGLMTLTIKCGVDLAGDTVDKAIRRITAEEDPASLFAGMIEHGDAVISIAAPDRRPETKQAAKSRMRVWPNDGDGWVTRDEYRKAKRG